MEDVASRARTWQLSLIPGLFQTADYARSPAVSDDVWEDPDVMRAQLEHLLNVAKLPNIRLRVLPYRTGGHPCVGGAFNITSFAETEAVDVVHVDAITSTVWVENEADSAKYRPSSVATGSRTGARGLR
ncbi:DUF5753 domain-containing protein [Streptomyces ureilyticus]|uniref:DUF5753 domain-containing protein n=1 Tax=Streptomyces ureilyticus TaxID=1775131 RepID=UPI001F1D4F00|nr:DUF5753 domain-containing protein [Streptomyces ureilyticus]